MAFARMRRIEPNGFVDPNEYVVNVDQIVWWRGHHHRVTIQFASGGEPVQFQMRDRMMEILTGTSPFVLDDQMPPDKV